MSPWLCGLLVLAAAWLAGVGALLLAGRREEARALAGFVPDCAVLVKRLLGDPRVARGDRVSLWLLLAYLASPVDLVPDVVPVLGQLDDALVLALVLRRVLRRTGPETLADLWPGPPPGRELLLRLAGATPTPRSPV